MRAAARATARAAARAGGEWWGGVEGLEVVRLEGRRGVEGRRGASLVSSSPRVAISLYLGCVIHRTAAHPAAGTEPAAAEPADTEPADAEPAACPPAAQLANAQRATAKPAAERPIPKCGVNPMLGTVLPIGRQTATQLATTQPAA